MPISIMPKASSAYRRQRFSTSEFEPSMICMASARAVVMDSRSCMSGALREMPLMLTDALLSVSVLMSSIFKFNPFKAASFLWKTRSTPVVPIPKTNAYPLFEGKPSFVARWALVILSFDVMGNMTFACLEGGQLYPNPFETIKPKKVNDSTPEPPKKPLWTRVAFAAVHVGIGGFIAAFLLSQRSSWVRTMSIVRPVSRSGTAKPAQLYVEVSGHPRGYGHPLLMKECALAPTKMDKDIMLVLAGKDGKFAFHPVGSKIGGKQMPSDGDVAKINMLKMWREYGGKIEYNPN
ncbi:hypothetical protein JR316_0009082 [Psilocybe cubensis]|uniref:Uncharacterized protein n=2 Tax=Psilocybe cubensis TaxID=181762 RepID=A0ACB8GUG4_PSICU|nr:hypothetical protein JR316_0009082 [Psilocybe cubensis]KAH9478625.1 hypothetical protein JR316_0009082 [Psilocybe cubensis]